MNVLVSSVSDVMFEQIKQINNSKVWLITFVTIIILFLMKKKHYRWIYIFYKTWKRDLIGMVRTLKLLYNISITEWKRDTIPKLFTKTVKRKPNEIAFYFEDNFWTFQQVEDYSNQIANYFMAAGYKKGDTVALLMENRPEYVAIWMGLAKIGVITALINTNLVSKSLLHCITVVNAKNLIYASSFMNVVRDILPNLEDTKLFQYNTSESSTQLDNSHDLKKLSKDQSVILPGKCLESTSLNDKILYIYTSGTTGLPKAAKITNNRFNFMTCGICCMLGLTENDIFYNPLPLYHASGGIMALGCCLIFGVPIALRSKFSASSFWKDCAKYNCTVSNYIGETCRYILAAHKDQANIEHKVTKMFGNGLKKDVWIEFVNKFRNVQICEGYGSTEGNVNFVNIDGRIGAVGFIPLLFSTISPYMLIKCNEDTNEPVRDANGFCIQCKDGEPGLFLGKIYKQVATCQFDGYADKKATNQKVLVNVLKKGDAYFNTGDILVKDEFSYYYFKDRIGDTYRWKGENIATTEIEYIVSEIIGTKDIVVYGVEVPNNEGKVGMIGIVDKEKTLNLKTLAEGLKSHLPVYGIPLFLRLMDSFPLTSTFKVKKTELQKEGFNVDNIKDPLYLFDNRKIDYVPLKELYTDLITGKIKL